MILVTSFGDFILYYCQLFFIYLFQFIVKNKKKRVVAGLFFCVVLGCPISTIGLHVLVGLN